MGREEEVEAEEEAKEAAKEEEETEADSGLGKQREERKEVSEGYDGTTASWRSMAGVFRKSDFSPPG